jgi:hypothetical protein
MRRTVVLVLLLCGLMLIASAAAGQTVLYRARIGNFVEGMTFVPSGPYANHIVMSDGFDVYAFPASGSGKAPARKLFNTFDLTQGLMFRGIAYITTEHNLSSWKAA